MLFLRFTGERFFFEGSGGRTSVNSCPHLQCRIPEVSRRPSKENIISRKTIFHGQRDKTSIGRAAEIPPLVMRDNPPARARQPRCVVPALAVRAVGVPGPGRPAGRPGPAASAARSVSRSSGGWSGAGVTPPMESRRRRPGIADAPTPQIIPSAPGAMFVADSAGRFRRAYGPLADPRSPRLRRLARPNDMAFARPGVAPCALSGRGPGGPGAGQEEVPWRRSAPSSASTFTRIPSPSRWPAPDGLVKCGTSARSRTALQPSASSRGAARGGTAPPISSTRRGRAATTCSASLATAWTSNRLLKFVLVTGG